MAESAHYSPEEENESVDPQKLKLVHIPSPSGLILTNLNLRSIESIEEYVERNNGQQGQRIVRIKIGNGPIQFAISYSTDRKQYTILENARRDRELDKARLEKVEFMNGEGKDLKSEDLKGEMTLRDRLTKETRSGSDVDLVRVEIEHEIKYALRRYIKYNILENPRKKSR